MSVADLARLVGSSAPAIGYLETGKRQLTVTWLERLAAALDCSPWSIVSDHQSSDLAEEERHLLAAYRRLPRRAQIAALTRIMLEADEAPG